MDHTVYERKNTDLGSTSMTKSGGFSIKKRHRKLGALIGLAALAVPFAANLGTLGDAIHAVAGPQNVYESKLLNVKLETSQDKAKTTWDLEFDRSDMSVSEQTVKFKLDLEKAGLTDAEIAIKDGDKLGEPLDMREGIVDAVLKTQSTHLILTAISSNEDKHDIALPITELGLYNEENGENLLPADNRSVDLTMAFEQVAEITKESSSETVTEAVAKEEKKSEKVSEVKEEKQAGKEVKVAPIPSDSDGLLPYTGTASNPVQILNTQLTQTVPLTDIQSVYIDTDARTTAQANGNTNPNNFQIWANTNSVAYHVNGDTSVNYSQDVNIYRKFDETAGKIDAGNPNPDPTYVRSHYHSQYEAVAGGGSANESAYMMEFHDSTKMAGKVFTIVYDNVGEYINANGDRVTMGATMSIGNIKPVTQQHNQIGQQMFIDIPNNLYSGLLYQGIDSLDIQLQFYEVTPSASGSTFTRLINVSSAVGASMTFASLNNFGNGSGGFLWTETGSTQINSSTYAESVDKVATFGAEPTLADRNTAVAGKDSQGRTVMKQDSNGKWFSQGHGNYTNDNYSYPNWRDKIGDTTFPLGALSYPIAGKQFTFRFYTGTGNTWQTMTLASINPLQLDAPRKMVTDDQLETTDPNAMNYNNAVGQLNSANGNADVQAAIAEARSSFPAYDPNSGEYKSYADYVAARETAVNAAITKVTEEKNIQYGNMFGNNLATKNTQTIGDVIYFNYDYWVMQPTYRIGTDSIAKPTELVMTDTLDAGVTLRHNDASNMTTFTPSDIVVYNTNGSAFTYGTDYTVKLESVKGSDDKQHQKITVEFTTTGRDHMDFDGNNLAWNLNVHVPATEVLENKQEKIWYNTANVMTGINDPEGIDTNRVNVHLLPLHDNDLVLHKIDDLGNQVNRATFELKQTYKMTGWSNDEPVFEKLDTPVEVTGTSSANGSTWTFNDLQIGKYELTETGVPGGYTNDNGVIHFTVTEHLQGDGKTYIHTMSGDSDADKAALIGLQQLDGDQWTASIKNPRVPTQFKLNKVDSDNDPLAGAKFEYALQTDAVAYAENPSLPNPWVEMTEGANGVHTIAADAKLEFNKTYVVRETKSPDGYAMKDDFYFIVVPQNTYTDPAFDYADILNNLNGTSANTNAPVNFLQVNEGGSYLKWLPAVEDDSTDPDTWVGNFVVANDAKSIFPRVGGTGIQAYIGAGLIVMLIAGGAAWYIKRRQNQ